MSRRVNRRKTRRRSVLEAAEFVGAAALGTAGILFAPASNQLAGSNRTNGSARSTESDRPADSSRASLRKLGQVMLSSNSAPTGGYSEAAVRDDGRYAVVGIKCGTDGTYLVDLSDPTAPRQVHHLPGSNGAPNIDAKFDYRNGLYYRVIEKREWPDNFEVVDYGYADGTPADPEIISTVGGDGVKTHNLTPHPSEPIGLYAGLPL